MARRRRIKYRKYNLSISFSKTIGSGMTEFGLRIWDFGLREGVPLMRHDFFMEMCPDGEK
jgi:hypothetical protein